MALALAALVAVPGYPERVSDGELGPYMDYFNAGDAATAASLVRALSMGPIIVESPLDPDILYGLSLHQLHPDGSRVCLHLWNRRTGSGNPKHVGALLPVYSWLSTSAQGMRWNLVHHSYSGWEAAFSVISKKDARLIRVGYGYSLAAVEEHLRRHPVD